MRNTKRLKYSLLLVLLTLAVVYATYQIAPEYSIIGYILLGMATLETFLTAHDTIVWRQIDIEKSLNYGSMPVAVVVAAKYLAFAIIIAAALLGVPKAAGAVPPVVQVAQKYVGQTETHGANRSPLIDRWNSRYAVPLGSAYCSTGVSAWLDESKATYPAYRGGRSRNFVVKGSIALPVKWFDVAGWILVFSRKGGGHVCVIESGSQVVQTIEPNTSPGVRGSQWNGGGIYRRVRDLKQLSSKYNVFRATHITPVRYV